MNWQHTLSSTFSLLLLTAPSFLQRQERQEQGNCDIPTALLFAIITDTNKLLPGPLIQPEFSQFFVNSSDQTQDMLTDGSCVNFEVFGKTN